MINIVDILKDCPKGTKLYSPLCGDCKLLKIYNGLGFDVINDTDEVFNFSYDGRYNLNGECCIFPSKENRDWNTFQKPFKDGDIVFYSNTIAIFKEWGDETLFRTYCVFYTTASNPTYQFEIGRPLFGKGIRREARFATEEEKQKMFDVIKANGYKWNAETKILEKLIVPKFKVGDKVKHIHTGIYCHIKTYADELKGHYTSIGHFIKDDNVDEWEIIPNKFDISTLKAYDEVLVRDDNNSAWINTFFGFYDTVINKKYPFIAGSVNWAQCIPYKGNEHLLGTCDDCDEYFKNW